MASMTLLYDLNQVQLRFHGTVDVREKDAIFNYRRKYLPTQQVKDCPAFILHGVKHLILHLFTNIIPNGCVISVWMLEL